MIECKNKLVAIKHRKNQEKYRVRNWDKIKNKNNLYFKKRTQNDPAYPRKLYEIMKKNNPETLKKNAIKNRETIRNDPEKLKKRRITVAKWHRKKREVDHFYRIRSTLSGRLSSFLRRKNFRKNNSILELIGCSKDQLVKHLEIQFYNHPDTGEIMTWSNYGKMKFKEKKVWEVDHIIPYAYFAKEDLKDIEVLKKINHFSNLQPMWAEQNRSKGAKFKK